MQSGGSHNEAKLVFFQEQAGIRFHFVYNYAKPILCSQLQNTRYYIKFTMQLNEENHIQEEIAPSEHDNRQLTVAVELKVKTYKSFSSLLFRTLNLCLSSFYFGYSLAYFGSFDFDVIAQIFSITNALNTNNGLLQGCIPVGGGIGALGSSIVIKKLSRRNSLLFINFFAFIAGLMVMIPNIGLLYAGRVIQGLCVGMYSAIIPLLIKQFSPVELSGTLGALNQTFIASGVFMAYFFQMLLNFSGSEQDHWRLIFGLTLITIVLQTILLVIVFNEQTPKYYLQQNRQNECIALLQKLYESKYVQKILIDKKKDLNLISTNPNPVEELPTQGNQNESRDNSNTDRSRKNQNVEMLEMENVMAGETSGKKVRVIVAVHLAVLQQMVGINSVIAYGAAIAQEVIPSLETAIPSLLNAEQIIATIFSSYFLSKFGRKTIMQFGTLIAGFSLLVIAIGFILQAHSITQFGNALIIIGLIVFMGDFGFSLGPIVWLYIAEIVQPQVIPFSTLSNWAAASLIIITFPILKNAFGSTVPLFLFYAVWTFISYFMNRKYVIETKSKTEKEIFNEYSKL